MQLELVTPKSFVAKRLKTKNVPPLLKQACGVLANVQVKRRQGGWAVLSRSLQARQGPSHKAIADPHQGKDEQGSRGFPGGFHRAPPLLLRVRETRRPYSNSSSSAMG